MNRTTTLIALLLTAVAHSQSEKGDYLVTLRNDTIFCEMVDYKKGNIIYWEHGNKKKIKKSIFTFADLYIENPSLIFENKTNLKIGKPEKGFAHVYLYIPVIRSTKPLSAKIHYKDEKLVMLLENRYYLHKVKAGETHVYTRKFLMGKNQEVSIEAEDGQTYFIRASEGKDEQDAFLYNGYNGLVSNGTFIFKDNPKLAEYVILSMKKETTK